MNNHFIYIIDFYSYEIYKFSNQGKKSQESQAYHEEPQTWPSAMYELQSHTRDSRKLRKCILEGLSEPRHASFREQF